LLSTSDAEKRKPTGTIFLRNDSRFMTPVASSSFALSTMLVYRRKRRVATVWNRRWIVVRATGCLKPRSDRMYLFCGRGHAQRFSSAMPPRGEPRVRVESEGPHLKDDGGRRGDPCDNVEPRGEALPHGEVRVDALTRRGACGGRIRVSMRVHCNGRTCHRLLHW